MSEHIDCIEYFYKSLLRLTKKKMIHFLNNKFLGEEAYNLLNRQDLYINRHLETDYNQSKRLSINTIISRNYQDRS